MSVENANALEVDLGAFDPFFILIIGQLSSCMVEVTSLWELFSKEVKKS